tara:strand:+ start:986 stop:1246 length:261 start_codon:yes stop_codon:yes gene_type:complete
MENKIPDFMKNIVGIFYLGSSEKDKNFWHNKFRDRIEENKETGKCCLSYFNKGRHTVTNNIKNFDTAITILNHVKFERDNDNYGFK